MIDNKIILNKLNDMLFALKNDDKCRAQDMIVNTIEFCEKSAEKRPAKLMKHNRLVIKRLMEYSFDMGEKRESTEFKKALRQDENFSDLL